jgi:excisionase family DNA binding protein
MRQRQQFGMRESPASDRRQGSRQLMRSISEDICIPERIPTASSRENGNAASPRAATVGEETLVEHERAPVQPKRTSPEDAGLFESLISSSQAAKLLGNLHVKTLQRYARLGRLPGYQIGRHWYFRESELDAWLRLQLNSKCQSVR